MSDQNLAIDQMLHYLGESDPFTEADPAVIQLFKYGRADGAELARTSHEGVALRAFLIEYPTAKQVRSKVVLVGASLADTDPVLDTDDKPVLGNDGRPMVRTTWDVLFVQVIDAPSLKVATDEAIEKVHTLARVWRNERAARAFAGASLEGVPEDTDPTG